MVIDFNCFNVFIHYQLSINICVLAWAWWLILAILSLRRQSEEVIKLEASLGYILGLYQRKQNNKIKKKVYLHLCVYLSELSLKELS